MTTQPEALRLAERLERYDAERSGYAKHCHAAAAELRRLHEANTELLAALKALVKADAPDCIKSSIWKQAFVAINKAERTTLSKTMTKINSSSPTAGLTPPWRLF